MTTNLTSDEREERLKRAAPKRIFLKPCHPTTKQPTEAKEGVEVNYE